VSASRPSTSAELTYVTSTPAIAGPAIVAAKLSELTRVFAASRCSSGSSSASRVYLPALPHACSSDETASSTTYSGGVSSPVSQASGMAPRNTARTRLSASSSRLADTRRRRRPNTSAPTTPGKV